MFTYWPWWLGAMALSGLTLTFWISLNRPLGVSGSWARVVMWRDDRFIKQSEAPFRNNPEMLKDALMAATIAEFGEEAVYQALATRKLRHGTSPSVQPWTATPKTIPVRTPWTAHLTFLVMLIAGGLLASTNAGVFQPRFYLGDLHTQIFGTGMGNWITLIMGGAMVGFGTQMAGGCTSGHGLSGCSRLVPASLIATTAFFGTAVVVSLLIHFFGSAA
jgi:uncharacterized protein